ncbi:MAG: MATE family efflux transporter [Isosphaeraceae bacterium]|nr:MATE family efflux transporter [Isosphaeraceae bacterium]
MPQSPSLAVPGATISRQVLWLAGPVVVEQALLYLVLLSDTVLTGRYFSEDHLAAVTVATYLLWFLGSLLTIVSVGGTALVARLVGSNQREQARKITQQSILLALGFGLAVFVFGWTFAPQVVRGLRLEGAPAAAAALFLRIVLPTAPLLACTTVGIACLRGAGDTRTGMWVMVLVNAINVSVSWTLVTGFGPFPRVGFRGIAFGTACAEGIGGLCVLVVLALGRSGLGLEWRGFTPVWSDIHRILRVSLPAAGESLSNNLCQLWFLGLINRLGAVATAAHGVAIRCEAIAFLTITAFAVAAGTLTGQYLGAGRPDLAERAAKSAWGLGVAVLCGLGAVLYTQAEPMFHLFLGGRQPQVALQGVPVLRVVAFAMPALATISVVGGALRGAGDTRWPWLTVVFGYLLVRMPLTYWLTTPQSSHGPGWGLYGAWIAMFADLSVRAVLMAARFLQGGWRRAEV